MTVEMWLPLATVVAWSYACYRLGKWRGRRQVIAGMADRAPTDRQLAFLESLAAELGVEPPAVSTVAEASRAITLLKTMKRGEA